MYFCEFQRWIEIFISYFPYNFIKIYLTWYKKIKFLPQQGKSIVAVIFIWNLYSRGSIFYKKDCLYKLREERMNIMNSCMPFLLLNCKKKTTAQQLKVIFNLPSLFLSLMLLTKVAIRKSNKRIWLLILRLKIHQKENL
jgi:hypothetical protein